MLEDRPLTAAVMRTFRTKGEVNPRVSFTAYLPEAINAILTLYGAPSLMANLIVIFRSLIYALGIKKELLRTEAANSVISMRVATPPQFSWRAPPSAHLAAFCKAGKGKGCIASCYSDSVILSISSSCSLVSRQLAAATFADTCS